MTSIWIKTNFHFGDLLPRGQTKKSPNWGWFFWDLLSEYTLCVDGWICVSKFSKPLHDVIANTRVWTWAHAAFVSNPRYQTNKQNRLSMRLWTCSGSWFYILHYRLFLRLSLSGKVNRSVMVSLWSWQHWSKNWRRFWSRGKCCLLP